MSERLAALLDEVERLAALPSPEPCSCLPRRHLPECPVEPGPEFYDAGRQLRALQDAVPRLVAAVRQEAP